MTNSKYFSEISNEVLLGIKRKYKNRDKCINGHLFTNHKIKVNGKWVRECIPCRIQSSKKSSKKYLAKKVDQKSKKFQFFGVS